jgi:hypothetical protein
VIAHRIMVEDGAFFKGKVDIRNSAQPLQKTATASEIPEPGAQLTQ